MALRIAINGFGRIGRMVLRAIIESGRQDLQVVAINDLGPVENNAHLLRYDTVHGRFPGVVTVSGTTMDVGMGPMAVLAEAKPENLPWKDMGIDVVMECSGHFTERSAAAKHLGAGARRVLVSAPATGADLTVVYGVNHKLLEADHHVVSCGSCTTNCLAPIADVLHEGIGIVRGFMTTVHAYTGDQRTVDTMHTDMRRARAAASSMIPSTTGAARALGLVLPSLKGKLDGAAIRVPTNNVSVVDLKFDAARPTSIEEIHQLMRKAADGYLKGILDVVDEPLVSIDFNHTSYSSNFDTTQTQVIDGQFCRVVSWYDNEWAFANRMGDVAAVMGKFL